MVIGWVDGGGKNHFHDRYAGGRYQPSIDQNQDYQLIDMKEENGYTSVTFKRQLVLPDADDFTITADNAVKVLWAWNDNDPSGDNGVGYHSNRGMC